MKLVPVIADAFDLSHIKGAIDTFANGSNGKYAPEDLEEDLRSGHAQAWLAYDGAVRAVAFTEVSTDRLETVYVMGVVGEGMKSWVCLIEGIKAWARERGSKRVEIIARPGIERYLRGYGFKKTQVILEADCGR